MHHFTPLADAFTPVPVSDPWHIIGWSIVILVLGTFIVMTLRAFSKGTDSKG